MCVMDDIISFVVLVVVKKFYNFIYYGVIVSDDYVWLCDFGYFDVIDKVVFVYLEVENVWFEYCMDLYKLLVEMLF